MQDPSPLVKIIATNSYADCFSNDGIAFYHQGKSDEAIKSFNAALQLYEKINNTNEKAGILNSLASVYKKKGNLAKALRYYLKTLEIIEKTDNKRSISVALNNIAVLYTEVDSYELALEYLHKSLKLRLENKNNKNVSTVYNNIGRIYLKTGDTTKASAYFTLGLNQSIKFHDRFSEAFALRNLGSISFNKGKDLLAFDYFEKSRKIYSELNDKEGVSWLDCEFASYYISKKQYKEAETSALEALRLSKEIGYPLNIKYAAKFLKDIYKLTDRPAKALEMYELFAQMRDSNATEITRKIVAQQEIKHEYEIKEAAAKLEQEKKDAIALEEAKKQKIIIWSICAVLIMVFSFAIFAYRSFLRKRKDHIEITQQKQVIEAKQKEILDSIHYAQRIQKALITNEKYIEKNLDKLNK